MKLALCDMNLLPIPKLYQAEILRVAQPWAKRVEDQLYGGFFESLATDGTVFDTNKHTVFQAQTTWAFAHLYQHTEAQPDWLRLAQHGADFLVKRALDKKYSCSAATDRMGNLILEATDALPAAYSAMALGKLHKISPDAAVADAAKKTLLAAIKTREKKLKKWQDDILGEQKLKNIGELTVLLEAVLENETLLGKDFKALTAAIVNEAMAHFYDRRGDIMLINVFAEGGFVESHAGREINAGLIFETCNALIEASEKIKKNKLTNQLCQLVQYVATAAWDKINGGFYLRLDLKGHPVVQTDWSQKVARVHFEALSALLHCRLHQPSAGLSGLFEKVHDYTIRIFFADDLAGDWPENLTRQGNRIESYWTGPAKNPYHAIRNLTRCAQMAEK